MIICCKLVINMFTLNKKLEKNQKIEYYYIREEKDENQNR